MQVKHSDKKIEDSKPIATSPNPASRIQSGISTQSHAAFVSLFVVTA
jgi:hypothetical protein